MSRLGSALALAALSCTACVAPDTVALSSTPLLRDGGCPARMASLVAKRALCGCSTLNFNPNLTTDGFDSRVATWAPGAGRGDVGVNAWLRFPNELAVGGTLEVGGPLAGDRPGIDVGTRLTVAKDLRVGGDMNRPSSVVVVSGRADIGGNVAVSSLDVAGTLTMPATASTNDTKVTAGATETAEVSVAAPCLCDPSAGIDVAAIVDSHREDNDDAANALSPAVFADFSGDATIDLPRGLFFFDGVRMAAGGTLTIRATGRAVVFVRGDQSPLKLVVAPAGELDLFVSGDLFLAAGAGDPERPRALRVYNAGASTIDLTSFSGALYAPASALTSSTSQSLFGAFVVGSLIGGWGGELKIHYDEALASVGDACPP